MGDCGAETRKRKEIRQAPLIEERVRPHRAKKKKPVKLERRAKAGAPDYARQLMGEWSIHGYYQTVEVARKVVFQMHRKHKFYWNLEWRITDTRRAL